MNGIAEKPHATEEYIDSNGVRRVGHWSGCWCKKKEPLPIVIGRLGEIYNANRADDD